MTSSVAEFLKKPDNVCSISTVEACRVYNNILETIGNTPLVKLNRIPKDYGLQCDIYVKCEFMNPGGTVKDRIAYEMVREAERQGKVKSDTRFVEPTSGNTGIGLALVGAVSGYPCTIVTPDKNSDEKINTLKLLNAEVIQTPSNVSCDDHRSFLSRTQQYLKENNNAVCLHQFNNYTNPKTHYMTTGQEILLALKEVDMIVLGIGTGGTLSGIAHRVKEKCPECIVVALDPVGSTLLSKDSIKKPFKIEGIGNDFMPITLDATIIDKIIHTNDKESFLMAREVIRKEGILCGGSSGAAICAAVKTAKEMNIGPGKKVVVVLPDGIRNYMSKFVCDQWMEANLFKEPPELSWKWWNHPITKLKLNEVPMMHENNSCYSVIKTMGNKHSVVIIINDTGYFIGAVSKDSLRSKVSICCYDKINLQDNIGLHLIKDCYKFIEDMPNLTIGLLARSLEITPFVVIVERDNSKTASPDAFFPKGIVTSDIVWDYIMDKDYKKLNPACCKDVSCSIM